MERFDLIKTKQEEYIFEIQYHKALPRTQMYAIAHLSERDWNL